MIPAADFGCGTDLEENGYYIVCKTRMYITVHGKAEIASVRTLISYSIIGMQCRFRTGRGLPFWYMKILEFGSSGGKYFKSGTVRISRIRIVERRGWWSPEDSDASGAGRGGLLTIQWIILFDRNFDIAKP